MVLSDLRKIIREEISSLLSGQYDQNFAENILKFIPYLKEFKLSNFEAKNGSKKWLFSSILPEYKIYFAVVLTTNQKWYAKQLIYWKELSKEFTANRGKDMEKNFGPHSSFEKLVDDVNLKLTNNPLTSTIIYKNDSELNKDKLLVHLCLNLKKVGSEIMGLKEKYFDDIVKIYQDIKDMPEEQLLGYCQKMTPDEEDKQSAILNLTKMDKLPFYRAMKKMH